MEINIPVILWDGPPFHPIIEKIMCENILCTASSTGQMVLWRLQKNEDKDELIPFTVLVSFGVCISALASGISKFGDKIFISLTEDGTLAQWNITDGRCIAYWQQIVVGICPPWKLTVFKDGQFAVIQGNGPELLIVNLWKKTTQSILQSRRDWVIASDSFKEGVVIKALNNNKKNSKAPAETLDEIFNTKDEKARLAFVSLSVDDRLYIWEYMSKTGPNKYNVKIGNVITLKWTKYETAFVEPFLPRAVSICNNNEIILIIGCNKFAIIKYSWLEENNNILPVIFNTSKDIGLKSWVGGWFVDEKKILIHATDGSIFVFLIPAIPRLYSEYFASNPDENNISPIMQFVDNEISNKQKFNAFERVGRSFNWSFYTPSNSDFRKEKLWVIRSVGIDAVTLWKVIDWEVITENSAINSYPLIVNSLSSLWPNNTNSTKAITNGSDKLKIKCTCNAIILGYFNPNESYETEEPLPVVKARGYSTGHITLSILPFDSEPFELISDKNTSKLPHIGPVTCLHIDCFGKRFSGGYLLFSGGDDGLINIWWITVLLENVKISKHPFFEISLQQQFHVHWRRVTGLSFPPINKNSKPEAIKEQYVASFCDNRDIAVFSLTTYESSKRPNSPIKNSSSPVKYSNQTLKFQCKFVLRGHSSPIHSLRWNINQGILFSLCTDGILFVWKLDSGHLERRVTGNSFLLQGGGGFIGNIDLNATDRSDSPTNDEQNKKLENSNSRSIGKMTNISSVMSGSYAGGLGGDMFTPPSDEDVSDPVMKTSKSLTGLSKFDHRKNSKSLNLTGQNVSPGLNDLNFFEAPSNEELAQINSKESYSAGNTMNKQKSFLPPQKVLDILQAAKDTSQSLSGSASTLKAKAAETMRQLPGDWMIDAKERDDGLVIVGSPRSRRLSLNPVKNFPFTFSKSSIIQHSYNNNSNFSIEPITMDKIYTPTIHILYLDVKKLARELKIVLEIIKSKKNRKLITPLVNRGLGTPSPINEGSVGMSLDRGDGATSPVLFEASQLPPSLPKPHVRVLSFNAFISEPLKLPTSTSSSTINSSSSNNSSSSTKSPTSINAKRMFRSEDDEAETKVLLNYNDFNYLQVFNLSLLFSWDVDEAIDIIATSKIGITKPNNSSISYALMGEGGAMSLPIPYASNTNMWTFSSYSSGLLSVSLLAIWTSIMNSLTEEVKYQNVLSKIVSYFNFILADKIRPNYIEPNLQFLAWCALDNWHEGNQAGRLLLEQVIAKMPEEKRIIVATEYSAHLNTMNAKENSAIPPKSLYGTMKSNPSSPSNALKNIQSRPGEKCTPGVLKSVHTKLNSTTAAFSENVNASIRDITVIILGVLSSQFPEDIDASTARNIAVIFGELLNSTDVIKVTLAADLLGKGFSLYRKHFPNVTSLIELMLKLSCQRYLHLDSGLPNPASEAGYRALLAIGLNEPLLLLRVAGIESWKLEGTDEYRAHCIQVLLDLIRQNPAAIITHIPTFIEILLPVWNHSVDDAKKKPVIKVCGKALHELIISYPQICYHKETFKLAVGTFEGPICLYNLENGTKMKNFEGNKNNNQNKSNFHNYKSNIKYDNNNKGHTSTVSTLKYSAIGDILVSYSSRDCSLRVWDSSDKKFLSRVFQSACLKTLSLPPTLDQTVESSLKNCKIEWTGERSIRLYREDTTVINLSVNNKK